MDISCLKPWLLPPARLPRPPYRGREWYGNTRQLSSQATGAQLAVLCALCVNTHAYRGWGQGQHSADRSSLVAVPCEVRHRGFRGPWEAASAAPAQAAVHSPADGLLGLSSDEVLLVRRQDAQGRLLASAALTIHHVCALVHVDGALWEGRGLWGRQRHQRGHQEATVCEATSLRGDGQLRPWIPRGCRPQSAGRQLQGRPFPYSQVARTSSTTWGGGQIPAPA